MATTTPNFGWAVPTSTDLVKDGAVAIETLGDSIDASLVDLKGGTTGQVLAKASNTDMDFTWSAGASVPTSLGFAAGKNAIINGDFRIWQRGTTVTPASGTFGYGADRWRTYSFAATSSTLSQQSFTPGTAPVAGYEGTFFARFASTNTATYASQPIEDVRTFAGQTVTVSFWAKSASAQTLSTVKLAQEFGSGGSSAVNNNGTPPAITTSWARYSVTITVASISGKTIGTGNYLDLVISGAINNNLDLWGVQVEAGSTATAFQTATGTLQGELAACQRYYYRNTGDSSTFMASGLASSTTAGAFFYKFAQTMRVIPTAMDFSNAAMVLPGTSDYTITGLTFTSASKDGCRIDATGASGLTQNRPMILNLNALGFIGFTAEL
jgi:hypothetical protein